MNTEIPSMPTFEFRIEDRTYLRSTPGPGLGWQWALPDVVRCFYRDRGATQWWTVKIMATFVSGATTQAVVRTSRGDDLVVSVKPRKEVDVA